VRVRLYSCGNSVLGIAFKRFLSLLTECIGLAQHRCDSLLLVEGGQLDFDPRYDSIRNLFESSSCPQIFQKNASRAASDIKISRAAAQIVRLDIHVMQCVLGLPDCCSSAIIGYARTARKGCTASPTQNCRQLTRRPTEPIKMLKLTQTGREVEANLVDDD
jgi:hypothetical protein